MKLAGRIAKAIVVAFVAIFNGLFILRCCVAADQSHLDTIIPTDALRAAYTDGTVEILTHEVVAEISSDGYMSCYAFTWSPEAREVQITVRYNNSVFEYNNLPTDSVLSFTLIDSATEKEYTPSYIEEDHFWMYNYRRLVFSDIDVSEASDLVVYMLCGEAQISSDTIHYADQNVVNEPYKLSRAEKKSLE